MTAAHLKSKVTFWDQVFIYSRVLGMLHPWNLFSEKVDCTSRKTIYMFSASTGCIVKRKYAYCKEVIYCIKGVFLWSLKQKQEDYISINRCAILDCWCCLKCANRTTNNILVVSHFLCRHYCFSFRFLQFSSSLIWMYHLEFPTHVEAKKLPITCLHSP